MKYEANDIETLSFRDAVRERISTLKFQSRNTIILLIFRKKYKEKNYGIYI